MNYFKTDDNTRLIQLNDDKINTLEKDQIYIANTLQNNNIKVLDFNTSSIYPKLWRDDSYVLHIHFSPESSSVDPSSYVGRKVRLGEQPTDNGLEVVGIIDGNGDAILEFSSYYDTFKKATIEIFDGYEDGSYRSTGYGIEWTDMLITETYVTIPVKYNYYRNIPHRFVTSYPGYISFVQEVRFHYQPSGNLILNSLYLSGGGLTSNVWLYDPNTGGYVYNINNQNYKYVLYFVYSQIHSSPSAWNHFNENPTYLVVWTPYSRLYQMQNYNGYTYLRKKSNSTFMGDAKVTIYRKSTMVSSQSCNYYSSSILTNDTINTRLSTSYSGYMHTTFYI